VAKMQENAGRSTRPRERTQRNLSLSAKLSARRLWPSARSNALNRLVHPQQHHVPVVRRDAWQTTDAVLMFC